MSDFQSFFRNCLASEEEKGTAPLVDVYMFKVAFKPKEQIDKAAFEELIKAHEPSFGVKLNPFDGKEYGYIELGGWLGDQRDALVFIALCEHLGLAKALHPGNLMPFMPKEIQDMLAGQGKICLMAGTLPESIETMLRKSKEYIEAQAAAQAKPA